MDPHRRRRRGIAIGIAATALLAGGLVVTALPRDDSPPDAAPTPAGSSTLTPATPVPASTAPAPSRPDKTHQPQTVAPGPTADADEESPEQDEDAVARGPDFPVNENGQTYGSIADIESLGEGPDLIAVDLEDGSTAYVRASELTRYDEAVPHPDEVPSYTAKQSAQATAWRAQGYEYIPLTAYASDGETVVGTWTGMSL